MSGVITPIPIRLRVVVIKKTQGTDLLLPAQLSQSDLSYIFGAVIDGHRTLVKL